MRIPLLELDPINWAYLGSLPSEAQAIQLLWGHVNSNFVGFQGVASVSCRIVARKSICQKPGGCVEKENPCLLFKVKQPWIDAGFPIHNCDSQIIRKIINLKASFDKKRRNTKLKNEDKVVFVNKLKNTTLNLAPLDWQRVILREQFLTSNTNRERIQVLEDYIGEGATRYL